MSEENKEFISKQIAVYKTNRNLLEFLDKLKPASPNNYAKIHAGTDERWNGKKLVSCVGITIGNYAEKPASYAEANISPTDVDILFQFASKARFGVAKYMTYLSEEKIIAAAKGPDGRAPVTKLTIAREEKDFNGVPRKIPVVISIENGTGIPADTQTGGCNCKSGSYKKEKRLFICMDDAHFYNIMDRTKKFVDMWEVTTGASLYRKMEKIREAQWKDKKQDIPA